jgi:hypothetical protein
MKTPEEKLTLALSLLEEYEHWEFELISDNRCWGPEGMASTPRLTNDLYDKMLSMQLKRNDILERENVRSTNHTSLIELAFLAGRSKTSWEQFKKDYNLSLT